MKSALGDTPAINYFISNLLSIKAVYDKRQDSVYSNLIMMIVLNLN